ncbi:MAG: hypothetical protein HY835_14270, partial [Anaerolineae bacterium]|nr:hypothetical protein [Anaerolineae bacterium]
YPLAALFMNRDWNGLLTTLAGLPRQPDFWLWFYLAFAISATMLPSPSDRRAWLPVILVAAALTVLALLAGAGPWMAEHLAPLLNRSLRVVAAIFGISLALQALLWLPFRMTRGILVRLTGLRVQAG